MYYNRPSKLVYKYTPYLLIAAVVSLCAFSISPIKTGTVLLAGAADADVKVLGTSNLHAWSMEDKDVACSAKFRYVAGKTVPASLTTFTFSFPVHDLKSGKSGMDSKAYDAMKAKDGGSISFTATASTITPGSGNAFQVKSNGNLTIAGLTKAVVLLAACEVKADGTVSCKGTDTLKMSDYQIKPPTYMLGALKTGNKLTIDFTMTVKKIDLVIKKIILPGLVAGSALLVLSIVGLYATIWVFPALAVLYFDPAFDTQSERAILYFAHPFIAGLTLSWFWDRSKRLFNGSFLGKGIDFGLLYWVVAVIPMMWLIYSAIAVPLQLVASWLVFGLIQGIVAGLILEKMNAGRHIETPT